MENCDLNDREFKIAVMKKLNKIQVNSESQFNELRKILMNKRSILPKILKP